MSSTYDFPGGLNSEREAMAMANNGAHYLGAIKLHLEQLYELTDSPTVREQVSDEIDWINKMLGIEE